MPLVKIIVIIISSLWKECGIVLKSNDVIHVTVTGFAPFGIFIKYQDYIGLIHISEVSKKFVKDVSKYAKIDEIICVKVLEVDENLKRIKCSLKRMYDKDDNYAGNYLEEGKGFLPLKENLPKWIREYNGNNKNSFRRY